MARRARKPLRRRGTRDRWLEAIVAARPELEEELKDLRRRHAQGYRKRLVALAWELNLAPPQAPREYPHEPSPSTRPAPEPASAESAPPSAPTQPPPPSSAEAPPAEPARTEPLPTEPTAKRGKKKKAE